MKHEIRGTEKPVPEHLDSYLSDLQKLGLRQAEEYGWEVQFVRRGKGKRCTTFINQPDGMQNGVLCEDGTIDTELRLALRH